MTVSVRSLARRTSPPLLLSLQCLASAASAQDTLRILPVGDSITQGSSSRSYRTPLVRALGDCPIAMLGSENRPSGEAQNCTTTNADHEGHGGWRTRQFLETVDGRICLEGYVSATAPDVVVLHIGSNDMNGGKDPGRYDSVARSGSGEIGEIGEIDRMVDIVFDEAPSATLFVANLIPWPATASVDADITTLRGEIESLVSARADTGERIVLVDVADGFEPTLLQADLIHPNADGDTFIAARWLQAMRGEGLCTDTVIVDDEPPDMAALLAIGEAAEGDLRYEGLAGGGHADPAGDPGSPDRIALDFATHRDGSADEVRVRVSGGGVSIVVRSPGEEGGGT